MRAFAHAREEVFDRRDQRELGLAFKLESVHGLDLGQNGALLSLQRAVPFAQLVQREQVCLVSIEQTPALRLVARQRLAQSLHATACRRRVVGCRQSAIDFGLDELRIFQKREHLVPYRIIEFVGADRRIVTYGTFGTPPTVDAVTSYPAANKQNRI